MATPILLLSLGFYPHSSPAVSMITALNALCCHLVPIARAVSRNTNCQREHGFSSHHSLPTCTTQQQHTHTHNYNQNIHQCHQVRLQWPNASKRLIFPLFLRHKDRILLKNFLTHHITQYLNQHSTKLVKRSTSNGFLYDMSVESFLINSKCKVQNIWQKLFTTLYHIKVIFKTFVTHQAV